MMVRPSQRRHRRSGLAAVAVLVCLVLVTLMSGLLLKLSLLHRDQVRSQERRLQAEWLAQSGLERALARLASAPDYNGETWVLAAADLGTGPSAPATPGAAPAAVVRITVERLQDGASRLIKVQADYPPAPPRRVRHSLQMVVQPDALKTGVSP